MLMVLYMLKLSTGLLLVILVSLLFRPMKYMGLGNGIAGWHSDVNNVPPGKVIFVDPFLLIS